MLEIKTCPRPMFGIGDAIVECGYVLEDGVCPDPGRHARGLTVEVYRAAGFPDCTLNGVSATHDRLTLIGRTVSGPFEPSDTAPPIVLHACHGGSNEPFVMPWGVPGRPMFGGNFAATSDSRFNEAIKKFSKGKCSALRIHDRYER